MLLGLWFFCIAANVCFNQAPFALSDNFNNFWEAEHV